jgi:hypothetical protein
MSLLLNFSIYLFCKFSSTLLRKISDDIDRALNEGQEISAADRVIRVAAKSMASAAKQAADRIQA